MLPYWPNLYQMILREPRATLRFNDWNDCPFLYISADDKQSHGPAIASLLWLRAGRRGSSLS